RGGIPLAGGAATQVDVRAATREQAELQRGTQRLQHVALADQAAQRVLLRAAVRAAAGDGGRPRQRARADALPVAALFRLPPRADTARGDVQVAGDRRQHNAQHGPVVLDQRDVDRELAVALDELAGTVERIDQPVPRPRFALLPRRLLGFFGNERQYGLHVRQAFGNHLLRGKVGGGERGAVVLQLDVEV